jgi:hypothetical protein
MTPEEALRNILKLVEGSDELDDAQAAMLSRGFIVLVSGKAGSRATARTMRTRILRKPPF